MKYLCIDTNIYVQCCLLELEGDDINALTKLHTLLNKSKIKLLLPEIVELEFYRVLESKSIILKKKVGSYKEVINKDGSLDKKIKNDLINKLGECINEREKNKEKVKKEIREIFSNEVGIIKDELKIKPEHIVDAYKLFLAGKKPSKSNNQVVQADCLIIEILADYFKDKKGYELFFCSRNKEDFALILGKEDKKIKIHPEISKRFKHIEYYTNLYQLLNDKFKAKYSKKLIKELEKKTPELYSYSPSLSPSASPSTFDISCVDFHHSNPYIRGEISCNDRDNLAKYGIDAEMGHDVNIYGLSRPLKISENPDDISFTQISKVCRKCGKTYNAANKLVDDGLCDSCSLEYIWTLKKNKLEN